MSFFWLNHLMHQNSFKFKMKLLPIEVEEASNSEYRRNPECIEILNVYPGFYARVGFVKPWVGYFASGDDDEIIGCGGFKGSPVNGKVEIPGSGWLILRVWNDHADPKVQDIYPYASTSPVYVTVDRQAPRSPEDATYFVSWLDRVIAGATVRNDYNSAQEKQNTLQYLNAARTVFQTRIGTAP